MRNIRFGNKPWLILSSFIMALVAAFYGVSIYLLRFVTEFGLAKELDKMLDVTKLSVLILVGILLLELMSTWVESVYLKKSLIMLKSTYISKLMQQDITQLQQDNENVYRSNLTNDFDRFEAKFLKNTLGLIEMIFQFSMAVVLVSTVSLVLVGVAFGMLVLFMFITSKTSKPVEKSEAKKSESLLEYTNFVSENLSGFEIIKQHQLETFKHDHFVLKATQVQKDNYKVDVKFTQVNALNSLVQTLVIFSLVIGGILFAKSNNAELGSIIIVAASFGNIMWPLQRFSPMYTEIRGIVKVLDEFDANLKRPVLNRTIHVDTFKTLEFHQCDLGYEDEENSILEQVNLTIKVNEKVLIVGASGAGKSTILKTIRQSIQPKQGKVILNGNNIYYVVPIDYYSMFSIVDQIGFIFNGTVKENVTLYQPLSKDKVNHALASIGLAHFDLKQPLQNNGSNVSGGQHARLMLARALSLDSQVILCDEIFSSLEHDIAYRIEQDILALNKTVINVSHIIFKDHLALYDKIYIVENNTVRLSNNTEEVWERMVLSQ